MITYFEFCIDNIDNIIKNNPDIEHEQLLEKLEEIWYEYKHNKI
jgi:hypothetical protein